MSVEEICQRYGTSKSSLHRWRQQRRSGMLNSVEGNREVKRICRDKLLHVKRALVKFVEERGGVGLGYEALREEALRVRDELLRGYEVERGLSVLSVPVDGEGDVEGGQGAEAEAENAAAKVAEGAVENSAAIAAAEAENAAAEGAVENSAANVAAEDENAAAIVAEGAVENSSANAADENDAIHEKNDADTMEEGTDANPTDSIAELKPEEASNTVQITDEEYHHLTSFKASNSWLREVSRKYNFILENNEDTNNSSIISMAGDTNRVLYENYYHPHTFEGAIREEQVDNILNGHADNANALIEEGGDVKGFV